MHTASCLVSHLSTLPYAPACSVDETYGVVKESEADQILRNKALIIDEIESTVSCCPDPVEDAAAPAATWHILASVYSSAG